MKAKYIDGVLQGGEPITLPPPERVSKADITAIFNAQGTWLDTIAIKNSLPVSKQAVITLVNLSRRLRLMADTGEINRRYDKNDYPEYRNT